VTNLAVQQLIDAQSPDGGWGAYPGAASRTEATALATLALWANGPGDAEDGFAAGSRWLETRQLSSGAWPLADDIPEPSWSSSLATLALSHFAPDSERTARAGGWLLRQEGRGTPWWGKLFYRLFPDRRAVDLDPDLVGWPWVEGTFSWVEPTSYASMALKRLRVALPHGRVASRIDQADRLLVDRACHDGGWNYGNASVLGDALWPYPDTTALALLALADRPDLPQVGDGLAALGRLLDENDSILALGLGGLAFRAHGAPEAAGVRERLTDRLEDRRGGELRALAWAALALADTDDPLGVRGA